MEVAIEEIMKKIRCEKIFQGAKSSVKWVVASGLMSDVLTTDREDILLVSNLTTTQVVRTADMVEASAILIANDKPLSKDTIQLAMELNITLLRSELPIFEVCYQIGGLFLEG